VLHDESSLARVLDAAGGSWYVESLTDQLARRAWDVFTTVERAGGALRALDDGTITELIGTTYDKRTADIAHRHAPITGVSEYAFVDEARVERPPLHEQPRGLLPRVRYAQDFEALRDRTDAAAAAGERQRVYLATLGAFAAHSARVAFAANLFRAAGLECGTGPVEDFDGSAVACLCSSDKVYADEAAAAAKALHEAGARHVWLAGRGEYGGVDGYVYAGCDALAVLRRTLDLLEVPQ
jgi:Methylmalonyl-CoA mutase, N-terminal domain/subunit